MKSLLLALVLLLVVGLSVRDATRDSATADEPIHIAAGVAQVTTGTWLVNVEHPPLAKQLFGWGARLAGAVDAPRLPYGEFFRATRSYVFLERPGIPRERPLLAARGASILMFTALVLAAWLAAGRGGAGLLAAALVAGQTALFAHGHLATTDVPAALFFLLTLAGVNAFADRGETLPAFLTAVALTAALATKTSALLLLPMVPILILIVSFRFGSRIGARGIAYALLVPAISIVLLAVFCDLYTLKDAPDTFTRLLDLYGFSAGDRAFLTGLDGVDHGLARYATSALFTFRQSQGGRLAYFLGQATPHPSVAYHLVAILVKSPLVWLAAVAAGAVVALRRAAASNARVLFGAGLALLVISSFGPKLGVRHVLPSVVLFSVAAGAALGPALEKRDWRLAPALAVLALTPLAYERSLGALGDLGSLLFRPSTAQSGAARALGLEATLGQAPLADSNLDWGQDLIRLSELAGAKSIEPGSLGVAYFGGDMPSFRVPGCVDLLEQPAAPTPRFVAVSREYLLLGADACLYSAGRKGVERALALVAPSTGARFLGRAGDSIDLYELPAGPGAQGARTPRPHPR